MNHIFIELAGVLVIAGALSYLLHFLKQPSIIAYIIAGLLIGPLGIVELEHTELFNGLKDIGIALLLFTVGLDLDISQLKKIGRAAIIGGLAQIVFTAIFSFALVKVLGFSSGAGAYMAIALTFSSTIIVVKLLSEKRDLNSLYGKLAIGIFLMQDVAAIFLLIFLAGVSGVQSSIFGTFSIGGNLILTLAKAFMLGIIVVTLSRTVFPRLMNSLMRSDELMLIFGLAWSLGLAAFMTSPLVGFNAAIGGFIAGLALANTGAHYQITGQIKSLRDFFLIIFFIVLGSELVIGDVMSALVPALILSAFVLLAKPLIVSFIVNLLGYKPRTSFMTGVTLAQVSEFSLILMAIGFELGHVREREVAVITLTAIITIAISSYGILYTHMIYKPLQNILQWLAPRKNHTENNLGDRVFRNHIVLVGSHRLGSHITDALRKSNHEFVIVDFNPDVAEHYTSQGIPAICGDITDPYIQEVAGLAKAKLIVSTVPDLHDTLAIIEAVKAQRKRIRIIAAGQDEYEASTLYDHGVDYVLLPHFIGGLHLADIVGATDDPKKLKRLHDKHIKSIHNLLKDK